MSHARICMAASAHRLFKLWQDQNRLHRRVRRPQSQVAGKGSACEVDRGTTGKKSTIRFLFMMKTC